MYKKNQQAKKDKPTEKAKPNRIFHDQNIQPNLLKIEIPLYLSIDNQIIFQLYENPQELILKIDKFEISRENFIKTLEEINIKLIYIRALCFEDFWCAMYCKDVKEFLDNFVMNFNPFILENIGRKNFDDFVKKLSNLISSILKSILSIYHRISSYSEINKEINESHEISQKTYSKIVFDNFLIDTAKMLDFCGIFGKTNHVIVNSIIHNIFNNEQRYFDDLIDCIGNMKDVFYNIAKEAGILIEKHDESSDYAISKMIYRIYDICKGIISIASFFPSEGVDELIKIKAYLWLPILRDLTIKLAKSFLNEPKPYIIRLVNEIIENTIDGGVILVNMGILLRQTFVTNDF